MTFLRLIVSKISRITLKMVAIFVKWPPKWRIYWRDGFGNTFSGMYAPQNLHIESTLKALRLLVSEIDVYYFGNGHHFVKWLSQCQIEWCGIFRNTFFLKSMPHKTYIYSQS